MADSLPIALLHLEIRHGEVAENRAALLAHAEQAARDGARIIVAPEMAVSGYSFDGRGEVAAYAEAMTGDTVAALAEIARRYGVYCCVGLAERDPATEIYYNSACVIGPEGAPAAHHRKHVAERQWATPGAPTRRNMFATPWGRIGVLICSDTYYGLLPRSLALQEVALLLVPANWPPAGLDPREIWRARALENGMGVVACNRTGVDRRMDCRRAPSYAVTGEGQVLHDAASAASAIHHLAFPLEEGRLPAAARRAALAGRRPADYGAIALDMNGLGDFAGLWGLPPGGPFSVQCLIAAPGTPVTDEMIRRALDDDARAHPGVLLIAGRPTVSLDALMAALRGREQAVLTRVGEALHLISADRHVILPPETGAVTADFGPARLGIAWPAALRHPEVAVALSKQGCDAIVTLADRLDADARLLFGIKCLEKVLVAVASPDGAMICEPPGGHARWRETYRRGPSVCQACLDTAATRNKRFLDRVDLEVLLRR